MNSCDGDDRGGSGPYGGGGFARYCLVTGLVAAAVGAAASLLGGGLAVRLVVWALVLLLVTVAAGWWWAWAPATAHRWTVGLLVRPAVRRAPTRMPSRKS